MMHIILVTGFNSKHEKEEIAEGLSTVKKELRTIPKSAPTEVIKEREKLIETIETLTENVEESSNYKAKRDISSSFSKTEKKIVQAMLEVLTRNFARETVNSLYQEFLEEIMKKGK